MIVIPPENFHYVEVQLRMIRESQADLIEAMTTQKPSGVFEHLCAAVLALHLVVEQMLADAAQEP